MHVGRLLRLQESEEYIKVLVHWKGLPEPADSFESLQKVYEDVPKILINLLNRKFAPQALAARAKREFDLWEW